MTRKPDSFLLEFSVIRLFTEVKVFKKRYKENLLLRVDGSATRSYGVFYGIAIWKKGDPIGNFRQVYQLQRSG